MNMVACGITANSVLMAPMYFSEKVVKRPTQVLAPPTLVQTVHNSDGSVSLIQVCW